MELEYKLSYQNLLIENGIVLCYFILLLFFEEQNKSSDIEQQPPFDDRKFYFKLENLFVNGTIFQLYQYLITHYIRMVKLHVKLT